MTMELCLKQTRMMITTMIQLNKNNIMYSDNEKQSDQS